MRTHDKATMTGQWPENVTEWLRLHFEGSKFTMIKSREKRGTTGLNSPERVQKMEFMNFSKKKTHINSV